MNGDIPTPRPDDSDSAPAPSIEEIGGAPDRPHLPEESAVPLDAVLSGTPDSTAPRKSKTKRTEKTPSKPVRWPLYTAVGCLVVPCLCCAALLCGTVAVGASLAAVLNNAKATISGTETVAVDGGAVVTLEVTNRVGSIAIKAGTTDEVRVEYTKTGYGLTKSAAQKELDNITVTVTQPDDNRVVVDATVDREKNTFFSLADNVDLTITVPPDVRITVQQNVGEVKVTGVSAQQLDITDNTGTISFDGTLAALSGATFRLHTNVGEIKLTLPRDTYAAVKAQANVGSVDVAPDFAISDQSGSKTGAGAVWNGTLGSNAAFDPPPLELGVNTGGITINAQ